MVDPQRDAQLYTLLELGLEATPEDVRLAYRRLARLWHPDRHRGDEATMHAKRRFQEIVGAYEVLNDPDRRQAYDMGLIDLLDVEEYLKRFQDLTLTASGLGMRCCSFSHPAPAQPPPMQTRSGSWSQPWPQHWNSSSQVPLHEEAGMDAGEASVGCSFSMSQPQSTSFPGARRRWSHLLTAA